MNILILNGSPKGKHSITLQTCLYLQKLYPAHTYETIHVGKTIRSLEQDFSPAIAALEQADLILFAYPVYTFLTPCQFHRFLELMKENKVNVAGKFATQITTSKHFYDVTAHAFVEDNCADLGLKYIKGLSADMEDLLSKKGQQEAAAFFHYVQYCMKHDLCELPSVRTTAPKHLPVTLPPAAEGEKKGDVVIVADLAPEDTQLAAMIDRFQAVIPRSTRVVNIHDFPFRGGCISCFNCATDGTCIYKDGFDDLLRSSIQTAEAIVIAFSIKDHSMGSRFKTYDDRQFCNGHRTVTMGMPFGYLISGNYSEETNLRTVVNARAEAGGNFLAGVATDEFDPDGEIDALCRRLYYAIGRKYVQPANFYGVGGMKIFRDLIWLMQGMMKADHKFYKSHGQYDFPQKHPVTMAKMYLVGSLIANPKIKAKISGQMADGMVAPYKKVIQQAGKQKKTRRG